MTIVSREQQGMTSFTDPDLVACPYCEAKHERVMLASFNNFWSTYYSDGGESFASYNFSGLVSRCSVCKKIIANTFDLPSIGDVDIYNFPLPPFLKNLKRVKGIGKAAKKGEYPRLVNPRVPEWHDTTEQDDIPDALKRHSELIFMWEYNQLLVNDEIDWKDEHLAWKSIYRDKHKAIEDVLIERFADSTDEFTNLVVADIYRRREMFSEALQIMEKVTDVEQRLYKKYLTQWVIEENTSLMVIPYK